MSEGTARKGFRGGLARRVLAMTGATLMIVLAVLAFAYRDRLSQEGLRGLFGRAEQPTGSGFSYEPGSAQAFAAAGNGLAVASRSSLELLDGEGSAVFRQVVSWEAPAVFASESGALFCDLGGTGCVAAGFDGKSHTIPAEGEILTAARNGNGWAVLATAETGYKALVSVYDPEGTLKYRWWSGSGYVLRAVVSPNGRMLAALCAENGGGRLHLFRLDEEEERATAEFPNALPFDLAFLDNESLCAVSSGALWFLSSEGEETGRYAFDGYLIDYTLEGGDFAAACISASLAGTDGSLMTFDRAGAVLGSSRTERAPVSLSAAGKRLLLMTAGELTLYDRGLSPLYSDNSLMTAKAALLRADGKALLLNSFNADLLSLKYTHER